MKGITRFFFIFQCLTIQQFAFADNFGAIAYDLKTDSYGVTWDQSSQSIANQIALGQCAAKSKNCFVVFEFANNCGAYSTGKNEAWGHGFGPTKEAAEKAATYYCSQNGTGCILRVWACNSGAGGAVQTDSISNSHADPDAPARNRANAEQAKSWGGQEQYDKVCRESPGGC